VKTYDQEEEDHRTTMLGLTARSTELAEKANYMRNTIEDGAANREDLNSQVGWKGATRVLLLLLLLLFLLLLLLLLFLLLLLL
jgi:hypothetical protein